MKLQETILCSVAPSSQSAGLGVISIHDIKTGTTLAAFKQSNATSHCVAIFESSNLEGGFILASQSDKSIINVYDFQKDQVRSKIVLPEKLTCIVLDRRGNLCAGGTASGRIYLWEVASGILFNFWDAHYRQVNVLRFTHDGSALISGSDDSSVNVWSLSRLMDDETQHEHVMPFCLLSDHTLPVTDIVCGIGIFPECRILTSSLDHSVKLWDLSSKTLLTTFQLPLPILCLAWDITERLFFAASSQGSIYQMNLFHERESKFGTISEAVGGAGATDVIRFESDNARKEKYGLMISVAQPIASVCMSVSSTMLLVGTTDGLIHLYDIPSRQLLRSISTHKGMSIPHIQTMIKPDDLVGHVSLEMNAGVDARDIIPVKAVTPFQRIRDQKARDAHEVKIMWSPTKSFREPLDYPLDELLRDHAFFEGSGESQTTSLKSRVSELEAEVETLHEQLCRAKGVNDSMWDIVVQKLISNSEFQEVGTDEDQLEEPKRKRAKT